MKKEVSWEQGLEELTMRGTLIVVMFRSGLFPIERLSSKV